MKSSKTPSGHALPAIKDTLNVPSGGNERCKCLLLERSLPRSCIQKLPENEATCKPLFFPTQMHQLGCKGPEVGASFKARPGSHGPTGEIDRARKKVKWDELKMSLFPKWDRCSRKLQIRYGREMS